MNNIYSRLKFLVSMVLLSYVFLFASANAYQIFEFPYVLAEGKANIDVKPEEATLYISLTSFDKQSGEALKKINLASDKVLNVMQQYKLPLDSLEASDINKSTERKRDENYNNLEILGYAFSRRLQLKLSNLASFSEIMNDLSAIDNLSDVHSQLIINRELGLNKNQNPLQGSFIIEELTDLVEEAILMEFERISERGGVLGAMETMYQRSKIQEESMHYEMLKHTGEYPIIGVNTFLSAEGSPTVIPSEVIRSTKEERVYQIEMLERLHQGYEKEIDEQKASIQDAALHNQNIFEVLMEATKYCSLGQISQTLYEVGGQYRRNM